MNAAEGLARNRKSGVRSAGVPHRPIGTLASSASSSSATPFMTAVMFDSPSPGATNLWLEPGDTPQADIIAGTERGLFVTWLFGHGFNPVTGDFSRGAAGLWIEGGELRHPVNEITIAGNLGDMLGGLLGSVTGAGGGGGGGATSAGGTVKSAGGIMAMLKGLFGRK